MTSQRPKAGGNGVGGALDQLSSPSGLFVDENAEERRPSGGWLAEIAGAA